MHTLLTVSSVILVMLTCCLVLRRLPRMTSWTGRRAAQVAILTVPIISLSLALGALVHFANRACFLTTLPWDYALGLGLPLLMGLVALGSIALGVARVVLARRRLLRGAIGAPPAPRRTLDRLARKLAIPPPFLLLCPADRPIALAWGLRQPVVLLSTWMLEHLDEREVEAVLAHELGHIARRDTRVIWLATVLRDAFWYVPTSRLAYQQLQDEKEFACDELAASVTRRPLALASALAKVWRHTTQHPGISLAPRLIGGGDAIEQRITRLLAWPATSASSARSWRVVISGAAVTLGLLALQVTMLTALLAPMGCGPAARLPGFL